MTTNPVMSITDEQIAEIEAEANEAIRINWPASISGARLSALISRLRAAEMDAARYRWLRDKHNDGFGNMWVSVYQPGGWVSIDTAFSDDAVPADELDLDAAIDTAMKGEQQ